LREAFGCTGAVEPDRLHATGLIDVADAAAAADVPVWFASLTATE
jgi:hypothetical protein